jgi:hypothetical protein
LLDLAQAAKQFGSVFAHFTAHETHLASDVFYGSGKAYNCRSSVVVTAQHATDARRSNAENGTSSSSENLNHWRW